MGWSKKLMLKFRNWSSKFFSYVHERNQGGRLFETVASNAPYYWFLDLLLSYMSDGEFNFLCACGRGRWITLDPKFTKKTLILPHLIRCNRYKGEYINNYWFPIASLLILQNTIKIQIKNGDILEEILKVPNVTDAYTVNLSLDNY